MTATSFAFKTPLMLAVIPLIFMMMWLIARKQGSASFLFPSQELLKGIKPSWRIRLRWLPNILRMIALTFFLIALAGPRSVSEQTEHKSEGIDIVLALDISGSMAAEDFKIEGARVNRLEIVKKVVQEFVAERQNDRIGLVGFAAVAYTICPLTTDYSWLQTNLERLELGLIANDGTAVGSAIMSSLSRLKNSDAKSKIIILLTDGMSNAGNIDPVQAARAVESFGIKIYTIGAGTKGYVPFPTTDLFGRSIYQKVKIDLDEDSLKQVADITGGKYFRATDTESLRNIYKEIDQLEKTEIEEYGYFEYDELFDRFLIMALILLGLEIILSRTVLLKIP